MKVGILATEVRRLTPTESSALRQEAMVFDSVSSLLGISGVDVTELDGVALASSDGLDGRAISSMMNAASVGAYGRSMVNSSSAPEHALICAALQIGADRSTLMVVAAWSKASEAPVGVVDNLSMDPFFLRGVRLNRIAHLGLQAADLQSRLRIPHDDIRALATWARSRCPNPSDALETSMAAWPLRQHDVPPEVDGCVTMLLGTKEQADTHGLPFVRIRSMAWAYDSYWSTGPERRALAVAAEDAYRRAEITSPGTQIDVAELSDLSPHHLLDEYVTLRLSRTDDPRASLDQLMASAGSQGINPNGGLHAGNLGFASGLERVAAAAEDLAIGTSALALAQTWSGHPPQAAAVVILEASQS